MPTRPCVSVLMPCRNAGPFLREAVASVLQQPECLELLVADGGSSDGSLQLLEELAASDPRVRLVSRSDAGPADALNQAFRAARGTLIGWLNADDLYPPGALARAVAANDHEAAAADPSRDPAVLARYRERFSCAAAGAWYRARLEELRWQQRELGGAVEVEGGYGGLRGRGLPVPAWDGLVADGARPPQALETTWKHR